MVLYQWPFDWIKKKSIKKICLLAAPVTNNCIIGERQMNESVVADHTTGILPQNNI